MIKNFSQYLQEKLDERIKEIKEERNMHLEHIEDLVLLSGVDGTRTAINFLRDLRDMLAGDSSSQIQATVKWDGAPAIWAGYDPEDGQFFVAKKSIFNKTPKVYKTANEVRLDTKGDLQKKMLLALKHLPEIGIPKDTILQGDFLYDSSTLNTETIDGEKVVSFHPNTIVYTIPKNSSLAKEILSSKIGIIWHTTYRGSSLSQLSASFAGNIKSKLKNSRNVWFDDASYKDLSGTVNFTKSETDEINKILSSIGKKFQKMQPEVLNEISQDPKLLKDVKVFVNSRVRAGSGINGGKATVEEMKRWLEQRWQDRIDKLKTDAGQEKKRTEMEEVLSYFDRHSNLAVSRLFDIMVEMVEAKQMIIKKLNMGGSMNTFVRTKDGLKVVGQEGFVAVSNNKAVKLVDRLEFSRNNFSENILKGWQ